MTGALRRRAVAAAGPVAATVAVTLRGFLHDRGPIAALALLVPSLLLGSALASTSVGSAARLTADFGWAAAGLFGWLLALAHGSGLADRGGVLGPSELARPLSPSLLLAGRFLGLGAGLGGYAAFSTAVLLVWLSWGHGVAPAAVVSAGWLLLLRLLVVLSLAVFFFTLARPVAAASLAAAAGGAGWFTGSLPPLGGPSLVAPLSTAARFLLPDFRALEPAFPSAFSFPSETAIALTETTGSEFALFESVAALGWPTLYAALYAAGALLAALAIFPGLRRRSGG